MAAPHPNCIRALSPMVFPGNECEALSAITCSFSSEGVDVSAFVPYSLEVPQSLKKAVHSRKIEFLVGRYLAKVLLENANAESTFVARGDYSQPIWPRGYTGSISHTDGSAICVLGSTGDFQCIGIDIEKYMTQKQISEIGSRIACDAEIGLSRKSTLTQEQFFSLLFSAKESVFKALFPRVNTYFEFTDVELTQVDTQRCEFEITVGEPLSCEYHLERRMRGKFFLSEFTLTTLVSSKR